MPENCANCHGTGKIIWKDENGKTHSLTCGACRGSGEKPS